jgi:hypothetical protein
MFEQFGKIIIDAGHPEIRLFKRFSQVYHFCTWKNIAPKCPYQQGG